MERKTLSLNNCEIKLDKTGRFGGYASTFNNIDSYGDTILPGAYNETLEKNGLPKMFVQHDSSMLPVGKWIEAKDDGKGLYVVGEFTPGMRLAEEAKAALEHETIDGLSIGFMLRKGDYKSSDDGRTIEKVAKLLEVSLVTFPADSYARINMKSEIEEIETVRDFERCLRESGVFSKSDVLTLINRAKVIFGDQKEQKSPDLSKLMAKLAQINQKLGV